MKAIYEHLPPLAAADLVACERVQGQDFGCQWHFHQEMEVTLVNKGGTHRWIGDKIETLHPGDLVFIGSNLPHDYRNEKIPGACFSAVDALVIQFHPEFLGTTWLQRTHMSKVKRLFERAAYGVEISGATRVKVTALMWQLRALKGLERLIKLLEILDILSLSKELKEISSAGFSPEIKISDQNKMGRISSFIAERLHETLYISDVANHIGMTEVSFSRYFRSRTGKTFPAYLNEVRIARLCRMLAETEDTISEIALACGFDSLANFEKQFHKLHSCSPKTYRMRVLNHSQQTAKRPGDAKA